MPQSGDTHSAQVIITQLCEEVPFDGIFFERIAVLSKSKGVEPLLYADHGKYLTAKNLTPGATGGYLGQGSVVADVRITITGRRMRAQRPLALDGALTQGL